MAELRQMFLALGYGEVTTYIQTGNVTFASSSRSAAKLEAEIEQQLEHTFRSTPKVLLRTVAELRHTVSTSPYPGRGADPARHHVTFLAEPPSKERLAAFTAPANGRDELTIIGREVYVHTPDGYATTKLNGAYLERHLGVSSTTRNWNTVTKLSALAGG
jgi:uncharacterized protein (DUF1697 family)